MSEPANLDDGRSALEAETAPMNFAVSLRGFDTEARAKRLAGVVIDYVRLISRHFDLSRLDGLTIAYDYAQALLDLDRGYETSHRLTPSEGHATGVAMTPSVIREGVLKSHIVLDANVAALLEDPKQEHFSLALHIVAHECAHVEVTSKFDSAFPGVLLRKPYADKRKGFRWQVILACWDEYAATRQCASFGRDPTDDYEETFLKCLADTRQRANNFIKEYRTHGDVNQVLSQVWSAYADLMKFAAYHLGNLDGLGITPEARPLTSAALSGHWFEPFFARLHAACKAIGQDYGQWTDKSAFEAIGDLAEELVVSGGIHIKHMPEGQLYVDIPYTVETMPAN